MSIYIAKENYQKVESLIVKSLILLFPQLDFKILRSRIQNSITFYHHSVTQLSQKIYLENI